jgi:hypothetical protein
LKAAASSFGTNAFVGTLAGLGLGLYFAFRLRANRQTMYQAFKTSNKPTHVKFADGREEALPDLTNVMKPTPLGDIMTFTFFSLGGVFLGGETGLLTGQWAAKRKISQDPEQKKRIERAFNAFRADVLRKQIEHLEGGNNDPMLAGW